VYLVHKNMYCNARNIESSFYHKSLSETIHKNYVIRYPKIIPKNKKNINLSPKIFFFCKSESDFFLFSISEIIFFCVPNTQKLCTRNIVHLILLISDQKSAPEMIPKNNSKIRKIFFSNLLFVVHDYRNVFLKLNFP
jgi:hypothetical protein